VLEGRFLSNKRILVVDDDPSARLMFKVILEAGGYVVEEAQNGIAALILIKEAVPDLVVTDMLMPRMDGRELIQRIRADVRTAAVRILAVTGHSDARVQAAGADGVLDKPFDRSALLAAVGLLVGAGA
jgi:two-component system, chemotaxis family, chemotaxis protein CheY